MCVCVCVCVCVCACVCACACVRVRGAVAQLVGQDLAGLQVQVTVMESYGIISLSKKLHTIASLDSSINEYLVIDWGGPLAWQ